MTETPFNELISALNFVNLSKKEFTYREDYMGFKHDTYFLYIYKKGILAFAFNCHINQGEYDYSIEDCRHQVMIRLVINGIGTLMPSDEYKSMLTAKETLDKIKLLL